jgi:uncharacterized protein
VNRGQVLIDAGPMVAIVTRLDAHHQRCAVQLTLLPAPLLTCWPAAAEAFYLVRQNQAAVAALFRGFAENVWAIAPIGHEALPWLEKFMKRYQNLGAQLADACLVYLAEREEIDTIFTLDHRDFSVYRYGKNRHLKIIPGPE